MRLRYLALPLALVLNPASLMAGDAHQAFHRAVEQWIGDKAQDSLDTIAAAVADPDSGADPETRAVLYDLAGRVLRHLAKNGTDGVKRLEMLRRGEYFAARAAHDNPYSLDLWRDYMGIAQELRSEAGVRAKLDEAWRYLGTYPVFYAMTSEGHRVIARAALDTLHGRDAVAIDALQTYIDHSDSPQCEAVIVLADLEFHLDRVEAANKTLTRADRCRDQLIAARLAMRIEQAETPLIHSAGDVFREQFEVDRVDEHRADLENVVLQDTTRLPDWCELWRILAFNPKSEREFDNVLKLAGRLGGSWETSVARLYSELGHGRFEEAEREAKSLLEVRPDDPHVNAALVLAMAWLGRGRRASQEPLARVWASDPYLTRCVDRLQLDRCLSRDRRCVYGAIVCNEPDEFVLEAFDHGLAKRTGEIKGIVRVVVGNETIARLNGEPEPKRRAVCRPPSLTEAGDRPRSF